MVSGGISFFGSGCGGAGVWAHNPTLRAHTSPVKRTFMLRGFLTASITSGLKQTLVFATVRGSPGWKAARRGVPERAIYRAPRAGPPRANELSAAAGPRRIPPWAAAGKPREEPRTTGGHRRKTV